MRCTELPSHLKDFICSDHIDKATQYAQWIIDGVILIRFTLDT